MSEALTILEEIKHDFVSKYRDDPIVRKVCNIMINEFKLRSKDDGCIHDFDKPIPTESGYFEYKCRWCGKKEDEDEVDYKRD